MTTENRLAKSNGTVAPSDPVERRRFWIERGNRQLWGQEPLSDGTFLSPQHNLEWRCKDGFYFITQRDAPCLSPGSKPWVETARGLDAPAREPEKRQNTAA